MNHPSFPRSVRGVALVLVLGFLVVLSAIVLAFFTSVTTLSTTSRTYASGVSTNMLANTAVQMVISQIRLATTPSDIASRPCWISQPGMIRVFGGSGGQTYDPTSILSASDNPYAYFKLYSSDNMIVTGGDITNFDETKDYTQYTKQGSNVPDPTQVSVYTDLNAPILVPDPTGSITIGTGASTLKYRADYPIIDPGAQGYPINSTPGSVEGFWLNNGPGGTTRAPGYAGAIPPASNYNQYASNSGNPACMPVKWLYVLRSGSVLAPTSVNSAGVAQFTPQTAAGTGASNVPSAANPIVGRIAFWTDDETCKININTAAEPTFWDTPQASSSYEGALGAYQPNNSEYQRYPGHPGTVALSPVFGRLFNLGPTSSSSQIVNPFAYGLIPTATNVLNAKSFIYEMTPRISQLGGSQAATAGVPGSAVTLDGDRLYPSVDEMIFGVDNTTNSTRVTNPPPSASPSSGNAKVFGSFLQKAKFFLTAYNRAPELNLYGQPRISIWPVTYSTTFPVTNIPTSVRTTKDKQFAFCSTIGNSNWPYSTSPSPGGQYQFYFQRQPYSSGAGAQSSTLDFTGIQRNRELYEYLQYITGGAGATTNGIPVGTIPGFNYTQTFLQKYPSLAGTTTGTTDRDQILTEIFDYIRSTNLSDSSGGVTPYTPSYGGGAGADGSGQVVPISINSLALQNTAGTTRGFGRFPTVSEAAIVFTNEDGKNMRATMLFEMFCPSYGYTILKDTYSMAMDFATVSPLQPIQIVANQTDPTSTKTTLFPTTSYNIVRCDELNGWLGRSMSGWEGFANNAFFTGAGAQKTLNPSANLSTSSIGEGNYPFCSGPIPMPANVKTFGLMGGMFQVRTYGTATPTGAAAQTVNIQFPPPPTAGGWPVPYPTNVKTMQSRISGQGGGPGNSSGGAGDPYILSGDSVRSVEAKTDLRIIAGLNTVPNIAPGTFSYFGPAGASSLARWNAGQAIIHSLRTSNGQRNFGAVPAGLLAYNTTNLRFDPGAINGYPAYGDPRTADLPEDTDGVTRMTVASGGTHSTTQFPGDFDTGLAKYCDGPYINKADEGNSNASPPYYTGSGYSDVGPTLFSPNRILCSAGWFGSLPTGVIRQLPYQTLLFRPDSLTRTNHPGAATNVGSTHMPADHLIMDLFSMPVVEPYPISEPFSTAGKINMNYQIMPFKYIRRETAMRALLRSEKLMYISFDAKLGAHDETYTDDGTNYRYDIDEATTLAFLEQRWDNGNRSVYPKPQDQVFRSPTQICELDLYPKSNVGGAGSLTSFIPIGGFKSDDNTQSYPPVTTAQATVDTAWNNFYGSQVPTSKTGTANGPARLTGDNVRERPYARLYSRLTTKSNTFTVHFRVQTLQKRPTDPHQDTWDETKDQVTGEYRGSSLIERYLDPADRRFNPSDPTTQAQNDGINPNHFYKGSATDPKKDFIEAAYKYRVVSTKQFTQ